ncbi:hypothetical protein [Brevundimonas sp.]|uniref:hypothetical protein n=1 Tax=Brevundimonas sp. TaxID=1871086 RepID=UPI002D2E2C9E|nr:hypothetical protein [Brevundimonas sp.]HYD27035.1 hypothetical protein [Brevundimonas sp.]
MSALAAAAFGLVGLRAVDLPGPRPVTASERLRIEVVHPVEPDIIPGARMDVGELVDGFQGVPPPPPPLTDVIRASAEGWIEDLPPLPPPPWRRPAVEEVAAEPPRPEASRPRRDAGRWFGFDAPRRDYQAERAARRARLEALDRQAWEEREARREERDRRRDDGRRWGDDRGSGQSDGQSDRRRAGWREAAGDDRMPDAVAEPERLSGSEDWRP